MLNTPFVFGSGNKESKVWIIGEAPGDHEVRQGKPFVGPSGHLFNQAMTQAGLIRRDVYIDNVFKNQPPRNDASYFYVDKKSMLHLTEEGILHRDALRKELEQYKPNLIIALGRHAMYQLTGKRRITKWRGSILECTLVPGLKVYPTVHPSFVMRQMQEKHEDRKGSTNYYPILCRDLQRCVEQGEFPEIRRPERTFSLDPSLEQIVSYLDNIPSGSLCAVDIETIVEPKLITRVGFSYSPDYAITIPFIKNASFCWMHSDFGLILKAIDRLFLRTDVTKLFQNGLFDMTYLAHYWNIRCAPGTVHDTMYLQHATHPHLPKSLAFLTSTYTWEPYYKDDGKEYNTKQNDLVLSRYNCVDCAVTREIFNPLKTDSENLGTYSGYKRTLTYLPSLLAMNLRGVKIRTDRKAELREIWTKRCEEIDQEISEQMGGRTYKISTAQTKDVIQLLYVDCGFAPPSGKNSSNDETLLRLAHAYPYNPIPRLIRKKRKLMKLVSQYTNMDVSEDGRVRTSYDPAGTVTWRLSSRTSVLGEGGNLQNIPKRTTEGKEIRKLFVPDEGKILLGADLKQAEAMVVAWLANEQIEKEAFLNDIDVHWVNTQSIFKELDGVKRDHSNPEHIKLRNAGKTVKHASNYGMGPRKLQYQLMKVDQYFPYQDCRKMLSNFKASRPMITQWKRDTIAALESTRTLITPLGRKRIFWGRMGPDLHRAGLAFVPQSTVGELLCIAIRDIYNDLESRGLLEILLNVHDEVIVQVDPNNLLEAAHEIKKRLEIPILIRGEQLTIPADFSKGYSWGELEEFEL